ncbi:MAG: aminotransferase class V-fold PLP-dependent enzyme, partial [Acidobacteriota bacterium]|nr:aminotransferase class V-fold PLP-dependent enzyme [Acidobacteriota bacterium]
MEIREQYRSEFPVAEKLIYLNHAAVAPLSRRAATAMQNLAQDALEFGSLHYSEWMATYEAIRTLTARMINADPDEIAIVKNTSEGIAMVATGIQWKAGDVVVAFEEEFPANYFPWKRLEAAGVEVRWLSIFDGMEKIGAVVQGAKLLAISFVQYLSGYRVSLEEIGSLCSRAGCLFFVDAIQGMGAFAIDVRAAKIDALSADGHKWLLGPEGCGVLYVRREVQDQIEPVQ